MSKSAQQNLQLDALLWESAMHDVLPLAPEMSHATLHMCMTSSSLVHAFTAYHQEYRTLLESPRKARR